jgi:ADP-heptose:LPS heptosyltransferase
MTNATEEEQPQRIGVIRLLPGIGDLLCAVPALRSLRAAYPEAQVTLIGLPSAEWFPQRFGSYVDELLPMPSHPGLAEFSPRSRARVDEALCEARARRFDLVLQMHGDGAVTNEIARSLEPRRWIGLTAESPAASWRAAAGGGLVGGVPVDRHEVERCLEVLRPLGAPSTGAHLEFDVTPSDLEAVPGRLTSRLRECAVVHPGASRADRRWPAESFTRVVDHLASLGTSVVLTGSTAESDVVRSVAEQAANPVADLSGRTTLGALAAVLSQVRVVVTNDTGVAHLAVAVGTPTVTVLGTSDRTRWAHAQPPHRAVGGDPLGRWPSVEEVCRSAEEAIATAPVVQATTPSAAAAAFASRMVGHLQWPHGGPVEHRTVG